MRKLRFREMEPIAKVLEAVSGSAVTRPAAALAVTCSIKLMLCPILGPHSLHFFPVQP